MSQLFLPLLYDTQEPSRKPKAARKIAKAPSHKEAPPPSAESGPPRAGNLADFAAELAEFDQFGTKTTCSHLVTPGEAPVPVFTNEFWTARQRQAHSLHEISYRACFKPQLPRFFIERLTQPGAVVYDPFLGRGTTALEAALLGRIPWGCDINPLSRILVAPRLNPAPLAELKQALAALPLDDLSEKGPEELLVFYHPTVLSQLCALRKHFVAAEQANGCASADGFLRMVATNRLTGHSVGYFSVYSLPPNQAVSVKSQIKINERLGQQPELRNVRAIIEKKMLQLLGDLSTEQRQTLAQNGSQARLVTGSSDATPEFPDESVDLVVTSPPFLNEVDYKTDNWLRCWFNGLDASSIPIWQVSKVEDWTAKMTAVFQELCRMLKPTGHIAFEVGEVRKGVPLEPYVVKAGRAAGLRPELILINAQEFTKTSNCWGVDNQHKGTNTNRIVVFRKR